MSTSRPILSVRNLNRSYPSGGGILTVMAGAAIDIYPGEMVGLVGPSGSGKSTLLHAAGLLEKPNEGEVFINGRECLKLSDDERTRIRRESIGVVYQFHHLQKEFTALENVAIPQMISGVSTRLAEEEATRLTSNSVFESLLNLTRTEGVSALIATHNMNLIPFFDRVLTVQNGLVVPWTAPVVETF